MIGYAVVPEWSVTAAEVTEATPEQVWAWYVDTPDVPKWDHLVKQVVTHGAFQVGTTGENIPVSGPPMSWILTEMQQDRSYTEVSKLPFATLEANHLLKPQGSSTRIEHGITVRGPAAWIYRILFRTKISNGMMDAMHALATGAPRGLPR